MPKQTKTSLFLPFSEPSILTSIRILGPKRQVNINNIFLKSGFCNTTLGMLVSITIKLIYFKICLLKMFFQKSNKGQSLLLSKPLEDQKGENRRAESRRKAECCLLHNLGESPISSNLGAGLSGLVRENLALVF